MITFDKLETKIQTLSEKIKALDFRFEDTTLAQEAETAKESAVEALEAYLDLANSDIERRAEVTKDED